MTRAESSLLGHAWTVLWIVLGVLVLAMIGALVNGWRLKHKPQIPERERLDLQAELLEAIKDRSANQRTVVNISKFWRATGVKAHQRNAVIQPLIDAGHVTVHEDPPAQGFWPTVWETARNYWTVAMYRPPVKLILTDRTWVQMAHNGISGQSIVFERVDFMNVQRQTAGGDIVQSPMTNAGRDGQVRFDAVRSTHAVDGLAGADVQQLVVALRQDAAQLTTPDDRARVRNLATKLENELDADEPDTDAVEDSVSRAERYLARTGGLMTATAKIFESWQRLRAGT